MRLVISLYFLMLPLYLVAQSVTYLYPVKVAHKWGYADKRGRIVVEPKYDAVGDQYLRWHGRSTKSAFRLVEADGKLGLINDQCQEVLPTRFDDISPLSPSLFIVKEDTFTYIVDRAGNAAVAGGFEAVQLLDTLMGQFLKVKKNELWGVHELGVGEILPPVYTDIQLQRAGDVFFKIKKPGEDNLWGLVNARNRVILSNRYLDIRCVNEHIFTTLNAIQHWEIRDSTGRQYLKGNWAVCVPLNRHFIGLEMPNDRMRLFSCYQKDTLSIPEPFEDLLPYNDNHIIYRNQNGMGLLDTLGNVVLQAIYHNIQPMSDSLFRVKSRDDDWGILSLTRGMLLPCEYDSIFQFEGRFAKVKKAALTGLIDTSWQVLIPPAFGRLVVADSLIKGYDNGNLSLFNITEDGQVALLDEYTNVSTLRVGYNHKYYTEATPARSRIRVSSVLDSEASPYTAQTNGRWTWKKDINTGRWGLTDNQAGQSGCIAPRFVEVLYLKEPAISLVFTDEKTTQNTADILPALSSTQTFLQAAFFSHLTGQFTTAFDLLGLRGHDFQRGLPLAAFLDKNGRFGLVDKKGKMATLPTGAPLRFTWIGEFYEGRARFCQGGRLVLAEEGRQEKTAVDVVGDFLVQYGMHTTLPYGLIQDRALLIEDADSEPMHWGYIDTLGKIIIEPRFDFADDFEEKFAVCKMNDHWGVIGMDGKEVLPFKYSNISYFHGKWLVGVKSPTRLVFNSNGYERVTKRYARQGVFSENRCQVQLDSLWGFIDEEGNEVIACQYKEVRAFSEGLAAVKKNGQWAFIHPDGTLAFHLSLSGEISEAGSFSDGLAWFKAGYFYGYIDKQGQTAIQPDFTKVFDFNFGVARAVFKGKTGLIDTRGQWIFKPERFEYITDFNEWGVAEAREKFKGKRCLINAKGVVLTPLKYATIGTFNEGFAKINNGQFYGLLNTKGIEVLPMEYEAIGQVSEGLLHVRPRYSYAWHFVDTFGNKAFEGEFEMVEPFQAGLAFVQVSRFAPASRMVIDRNGKRLAIASNDQFEFYENGIFGFYTPNGKRDGHRRLNYYFANANGERLFDRLFEKIKPYKGETALVQVAHRWGMLNRHGLFLLHPKYPIVNMQENGEVVVNLSMLQGLVDTNGHEIFPPIFDRIELLSGERYRLELGEKVGYAKLDGAWVWEMQK